MSPFTSGEAASPLGHIEANARRMEAMLRDLLETTRLATGMLLAAAPDDQARIVAIRKVAGAVASKATGPRKPLAFIEDAAVYPTRLPDFIVRMRGLLRKHGVTAGTYGRTASVYNLLSQCERFGLTTESASADFHELRQDFSPPN